MKKVALIFVISITISFAAFFQVKHWEEGKRQQEFSIRAQGHTAAIRAGFENLANQLEDMRFLIEFNINKDASQKKPEDIVRLLTPIITHEPAIIDVDWAVPSGNNKAKVIYSWRNEGNIEQHQITPTLNPVTAYFITEPNKEKYLQLIAPVTNNINAIDETSPLQGNTIAWLISEWDISTLIEESLKHTPVSAQDIKISSIKQDKVNAMYFHPSRSRTPDDFNVHTDITHTDTFQFLGLNIQVKYEAAPKFLRDFPIVMAWQSLIMWLIASLSLALYLYRREKEKLKFRRIIDNLQDVYYQMDTDGIIQMVSPSISSLGYTQKEVVGTSMSNYLTNPKDFNRFFTTLKQSDDGKIHNYHMQVRHKSDHNLWVSMNAKYIYDHANQVIGIEGTLNDYTKIKENQEKMQRADKLENLGLMAAGFAHNFNNILATIIGNTDIAKLNAQENSKTLEHLDAIEKASEKASNMCRQMLAYTGQGKYVTQSLNISQTIQDISDLLQASFSNLADIQCHLNPNIPNIHEADQSQIQQMVIDLVQNAAESYGEQYGLVHVTTEVKELSLSDINECIDNEQLKVGKYMFIQVSDQGCGIPKDMQNKIFEPFVSTKLSGRGLGLSAVRGIVRSHNGAIHLESEEGKGTTITIFFPVDNQA